MHILFLLFCFNVHYRSAFLMDFNIFLTTAATFVDQQTLNCLSMAKENEETLYGYFRRNRSRDERFWWEDDLRGQSDDRIAISIKSDNVALRWRQRNLPESVIHVQSLLNLLLLLFIFSFPSASSSSWLVALASNVTTQNNSRHVTISLKDNLIENVWRKPRPQVPYTGSINIDKWPTDVDYLQWRYYTCRASATICF